MDWLNYVVLGIYIVSMVAVAMYCRNRSKTLKDFFMAGEKGLGGWMTAFAYGTTYFSSVIFIGYAGNLGWDFGLSVVFIGVGNAVIGSLLAWKVLAKRTKVMTGNLNARTMPEFFEKRYNSKNIKLISATIMFVFLIPYSASVYQGLGYLFQMVFKIDFIWCILIMATLTALYLVFGGYFATAVSDFVQGIIMIAGVIIMVIFVCINCSDAGYTTGLIDGFKQLTEAGKGIFPSVSSDGGFFSSNFFNLLVLILLTSFGTWGLPQTVHKFYAIRNKKAIKQATIVSTLFALLIGVGAYFVGSLAVFYLGGIGSQKPVVDTIVPEMLSMALPVGLIGLIVVLVLSASMSTLSSLSLSGASAISVDVYKGYINKNASDKKVNIIMKICCLVFVAISVLLSIFQIQAIVTLMSLSWGTIAGCFLGPYVYGLYSKKVNKYGAIASLISGLVVTFALILVFGLTSGATTFWGVIGKGVEKSPLIGVIAMAMSMIVTPLFSLIKKNENKEHGEKIIDEVIEKQAEMQ